MCEIRGEIQKAETELKGEIQRVEGVTNAKLTEIKGQVNVLDERTKISFWGAVWRLVISGTLLLLMGLAVLLILLGKVELLRTDVFFDLGLMVRSLRT